VRMMGRRLGVFVALAVSISGASAVPLPVTANASCVGPMLNVAPAAVPRGGTLTVSGIGFGDDCIDNVMPPETAGSLGDPMKGMQIVIGRDGESVVLGDADAGEDYAFRVEVALPEQVQLGDNYVVVRMANGRSITPPVSVSPLVVSVTEGAAPRTTASAEADSSFPLRAALLVACVAAAAIIATVLIRRRGHS